MAILERLEPIGYRWAPPATVPDRTYAGRHRGASARRVSLRALFYIARHAHYVARHAYRQTVYVPRHARQL